VRFQRSIGGPSPLHRQIGNLEYDFSGREFESATVRVFLGWYKRWHSIAGQLKPLPERRNVGRALSREEKITLIDVARRKPEWQLARVAAVLALNTTMRAGEIRGLQWRDLNLVERTLTIRRSKTEAGERVIPLNEDAWGSRSLIAGKGKAIVWQSAGPKLVFVPSRRGTGPRGKAQV
jgi:integrase